MTVIVHVLISLAISVPCVANLEKATDLAAESADKAALPANVQSTALQFRDPNTVTVGRGGDDSIVIPTEQVIMPAGRQVTFPGRPIDMALSPDGRWLLTTTSYEAVLINVDTGTTRSIRLPDGYANSLHGVLFLPDNRTIYCAGHKGMLHVLRIDGEGAPVYVESRKVDGGAICGMALSRNGRRMYVAGSVKNHLLLLDATATKRTAALATGIAPYSVAVGPDGKVYVSNWGGRRPRAGDATGKTDGGRVVIDPETGVVNNGTVSVAQASGQGKVKSIEVGRFPCQLAVNADRSRLFVPNANDDTISVIDTSSDRVVETIAVRPDAKLPFGTQPSAIAVSPDAKTLYVACATNNSVAVVKLGRLCGVAEGPERSRVVGAIPVGWFPGSIRIDAEGKRLHVANVRGIGSVASPSRGPHHVGRFRGLVCTIDVPDAKRLAEYTEQVAHNNRLRESLLSVRPRKPGNKLTAVPTRSGESSVFEHVIFIIRENHTYDQDLGDMKEGNGDPRLCSCPERLTPNAHAVARQFVLLDNYHVPSVQSPTGHLWVSQGITTSYYEKALTQWPRYYSYTGKDALAFASSGFIWTNAIRHGKTFRNYGEAVSWSSSYADPTKKDEPTWTDSYRDFRTGSQTVKITATANIDHIKPHTCPDYPGYGYTVPDVRRAQIFIEELKRFEKEGGLPNLMMVFLPNNHTFGTRPGFPTPRAQIADNDAALGMIVEAVSHSRFWPETVILTTEDDPWNGTDHVAGSRSMCFLISPYTKRGQVISRNYSLTGLIKTIELILGLPMMNQLDLAATPMTECFTETPDFTPFKRLPSGIPLDTMNPPLGTQTGAALYWARKSLELPLAEEPDAFPDQLETFKRLFWHTVAGYDRPFPHVTQAGQVVFEDPISPVR